MTQLRHWGVLFVALGCSALPAAAQEVVRAEPPSWWVGMDSREVEVLVWGPDIATLEAKLAPSLVLEPPRCTARDGKPENSEVTDGCVRGQPAADAAVELTGVVRTDNPNYLFLTFDIGSEAPSQSLHIDFERDGDIVTTLLYPLLNREGTAGEGFSAKDVIYLITPDRFANGDPTNDSIAHLEDKLNRDEDYGRHGGDLQGIIDRLDYFADMGFTQLWLNPLLENAQPQWSYHGYAITDHYRIDARYGDRELYRALASKARERGMGLIIDIVLNHIGHQHWWMGDPPASDWINSGGQFVGTNHQRESLQDPYASTHDRALFADGWFVPTMPDLNQRNPQLARYLIQHSIWWIEYAGLSGIRVDTWPYSDKQFLIDYASRLRAEYPNINIVGEEWTTNPSLTAYWQQGSPRADDYDSRLPSVFDFPLQAALIAALTEPETWNSGLVKVYRTLANDFVYGDPMNLVTFVDNHDMSRVYTQLGEDLDLWKIAHAVLLTTRGIPQLYYGSELLFANPGTESHGVIRKEFTGGWPDHEADAVTGAGLDPQQAEAQAWLKRLLNWRADAPAVHAGSLTHFAPKDGLYAWRRDSDEGQSAVIVINKNDDPATVHEDTFPGLFENLEQGADVFSSASLNAADGIGLEPRSVRIVDFR